MTYVQRKLDLSALPLACVKKWNTMTYRPCVCRQNKERERRKRKKHVRSRITNPVSWTLAMLLLQLLEHSDQTNPRDRRKRKRKRRDHLNSYPRIYINRSLPSVHLLRHTVPKEAVHLFRTREERADQMHICSKLIRPKEDPYSHLFRDLTHDQL